MGSNSEVVVRDTDSEGALATSSSSIYEGQKETGISSLPQDVMSNILSRLGVVDLIRSRLVSRSWTAISGSPFPLPPSSASFLRKYWVKNKPDERWLVLWHERILHQHVLYDVQRNQCYNWTPHRELKRLMAPANVGLALCNTSANGLFFLRQQEDFYSLKAAKTTQPALIAIWAYNPLTGYQIQLPPVPCRFPDLIVAKTDHAATTDSVSHHKVLVARRNRPIGYSASTEFDIFLYSSVDGRWQCHEKLKTISEMTLHEVKSFHDHELICVIERRDHKHGWSSPQAGEYSGEALSWFSVENYTWYSCLLYPPELVCGLKPMVQYFEIFERNKEWILVAVSSPLSAGESFVRELRVFKSSSTMEPEMEIEWTLLSSWTMDDVRVSAAAGESSTSRRSGQVDVSPSQSSHSTMMLQIFPVADKVQGDKLIVMATTLDSKSFSVVSYNFNDPPESAWKTLIPAANFHHPQSGRRSIRLLQERIGNWNRSSRFQSMDRSMNSYNSGSFLGFTFEPLLVDLQ
ncbi:hypothetical protein MPTK1_7g03740 [Marchantia polymorpha subsp. ruderalis]|uniref:F-box domain-containing protein n=2 Tax=Marchantia polymorpha TaxID=3197 RepID=A0AAF6BVV0_MARPO|nr:hypothetical protein MARPO_0074s0023 [Marchantia polymorpha]BBN16134.1 hypothetical protein Mp_7g03740 [Marchantia polymorpha subsp. ruderalis]|eukprot:PTQ35031.1 hypothetical protein MARPO_0074s0023 [Marchantia polymorpha]